ncbi:tyrosine-type recombinase/integrase [Amycolatopsis vancoresmycina]|uniref:tyrosine-type recombinase/integrase n=1 Tax=Amycolatopsis vancoresmycina TaxID=208444 RepID=UPI003B8495DD
METLADVAAGLRTKYDRPTAGAEINRALILLLADTGLRWGEVASLRVGRVDLVKRRIRVAVTFFEVGGVQHEGLPKTGKKRTVSFPASLVPVLRPLVTGRQSDELVFTTGRASRCGRTTGASGSSRRPISGWRGSLRTSCATRRPRSPSRPARTSRSFSRCSGTPTRP